MKLPFKFYVLYCVSKQDMPCSYHELLPLAQNLYPNERQINSKMLITHLDSFCAVGALDIADASEEGGDLIMKYQITSYGKSLLKYVNFKEDTTC